MISIYEIKGWSDVAAFLIWTLAVCAIAKALFGSLFAAEIQYRFSLRDAPRRQRMNRLNWEINNRAAWDEDVARRSPHAARQALSDSELEQRRRDLAQLTRSSFGARSFRFFMGCFACQAFWTAAIVFFATRGASTFVAWCFSAAAYSAAAVITSSVFADRRLNRDARAEPKAPCKSCGR